jgi:hypothetical protein
VAEMDSLVGIASPRTQAPMSTSVDRQTNIAMVVR